MTTNQENLKHVEVLRKLLDIWRDNQIDESEIQQEIEALNAAIKALEGDRWIPVEERLPERPGQYQVFRKGRVQQLRFMFRPFGGGGKFVFEDEYGDDFMAHGVTHWRHLPEGPK